MASEVKGTWGDVVLGLVPWALDSSNVAQQIPPSNVLMGEVKLGFVSANEDAGTIPNPTSTKQNKWLVWWMETSVNNRTSEHEVSGSCMYYEGKLTVC